MENETEVKDLLRTLIETNQKISRSLEDIADVMAAYVYGEDEDSEEGDSEHTEQATTQPQTEPQSPPQTEHQPQTQTPQQPAQQSSF